MISPSIISFAPFLVSVVFLAAAIAIRFIQPGVAGRISNMAALSAIGLTLLMIVMFALGGPVTSPEIGEGLLLITSRLDPLNLIALGVVVFVGFVVIQFSRSYLDGSPRRAQFFGSLCLTLAAVSLLVTSGTLLQLIAGWLMTSLALHQLLLFYPDRKLAVIVARKKFWLARLGDVCLISASYTLWQLTGTADIAAINAWASSNSSSALVLPAGLLCVAALLKCAQFPTHGWLTEVMETPTPVSALLHAGIVNGGGYLVIRFADVVVSSPGAMLSLLIVGGVSALVASLCMLTQTNIKRTLAYSTVAQMGFMMIQCGLGAFASAALHLVAHSVYKAHSFLASGDTVEQIRQRRMAAKQAKPTGLPQLTIGAAIALIIYGLLAAIFVQFDSYPAGVLALGIVYMLGLSGFLSRGLQNGRVILRSILSAAAVTCIYFVLQSAMLALFDGYLPEAPMLEGVALIVTTLIIVGFALIVWLQFTAEQKNSPKLRRLYLAFRNGFYINHLTNRFSGVYRRESN